MLKPLYRQRRRILLFAAFIALCVWMHIAENGGLRFQIKTEYEESPLLFWISSVLTVGSVALVAGLVFSYLLPGIRRTPEVVIAAALLSEAVISAAPAISGAPIQPWATFLWFLGFYFVIAGVLNHQPKSRRGIRFTYRAKVSRSFNASPEAIWATVVPEAETTGTYWTQTLDTVEPCPQEGPGAVCTQYQAGAMYSMRQIQIRRIWQKPFHALYDHRPEGLDEAVYGMRGSYEVRIEPHSDGRSRLTITRAMPDLTFGAWSLFWLDDLGRCEMDAIAARLLGRKDWSMTGWTMRQMARA